MQPILSMKGISKSFPGVKALDQIDFELYPGEIHALMGENGAGKSTLMKILSGVYTPTEGDIVMEGKKVSITNPTEAQNHGISIIHQEFNLFPNMSVAENIFMDRAEMTTRTGRVNWNKIYKQAEELIRSIGSEIDVREELQHLSIQSQQVVEIVKALSYHAKILIMDEPSAALPENEVQKMFAVVRQLKKQGVAIVYVSHRMKEVFEIADKVTVLRDGKKIATEPMEQMTENLLVSMMVGKEVGDLYPDRKKEISDDVVLRVEDLFLDRSHSISFELKKGEILGFYGLMGSGTHTLAERLFGLRGGDGNIIISGQPVKIESPRDAMGHHIGFVPPDRHRQGLVKQMAVKQNISMSILRRISEKWLIRNDAEQSVSTSYIDRLNIKTPHGNQVAELLSGGNQQKVVLAKWLATDPKILIMEEPTRGVDVGAKAEIYELIRGLADQGLCILLISSDMPEVIGMSDRILVMHKGIIVAEFMKGQADQHVLLTAASNPGEKLVSS